MKKIIAFSIAVITLLSLTACQATPDDEFVVKKDTERMMEQAVDDSRGTKVSKLEVPDGNYTYQANAADGKLTITVDAPVTVPKSEKIPTAKVSAAGFTQEQVTGFFNYLFPDEKPVTGDKEPDVMTKDEILELILTYKRCLAEGTVDQTPYTEDELKKEIENLERQVASAPETAPTRNAQVSDGTMTLTKPVDAKGEIISEEEILVLDASLDDTTIYVSVPNDANGSWENYLGFSKTSHPQFSEANAIEVDEDNQTTAAKDKLTITYEAAKKLCDGFFDAGNISDVILSDAYVIDDGGTVGPAVGAPKTGEDGQTHAPENYAYQFHYVRIVGDSPVANMTSIGSRGDENSLPWDYEKITFLVSDNGIESITWESRTATGEIISEDTGVMSFEEVREIFEMMIATTYGASEEWGTDIATVSVDINAIELSLVRVREQNASGRNGIYTPAWVFYGNVKQKSKNDLVLYGWDTVSHYPFSKYPILKSPVLVINAIDGSIIDMGKGY